MLHSGTSSGAQDRVGRQGSTIPTHADDRRGSGRPRSRQSHEAILDATLQILAEVGYSRLTVEGVAAQAGVGKTTVYRWWPAKSALVIEAISARRVETPIELTGDSRADLSKVLRATLDDFVRSPAGDAIPGLAVDLMHDPDSAEQFEALVQPRRDIMRTILEEAASRGELPTDADIPLLQDILAGTLIHRLLLSRRPTGTLVGKLVDLVLGGQVPRREPDDRRPA